MKHLAYSVAVSVLSAVNLLVTVLLLMAAYSPCAAPAKHPVYSCMGLAFPLFVLADVCLLAVWLLLRQWELALLPLVGLLLCAPQLRVYCPFHFRTAPVPESAIKLLSYNVMAFGGSIRPEKGKSILNYLRQSGADILCLQEYFVPDQPPYLRQADVDKALEDYPYRNVTAVGRNRNNRLACFSKFPILSARRLGYSSESNGSVAYELLIGGDTVTLINNHLESNKLTVEDKGMYESMLRAPKKGKVERGARRLIGKLAKASVLRASQADTIAREVACARTDYVLLCGDFNDSPISYSRRVIAQELDDAFATSGRGLGISYNRNKFFFRIDHILLSPNLKAYNCTVDRSIRVSDHYPIWCYISKAESPR